MKKLLLILLCLPFIGFGQTWEKTFGGLDGGYLGNSVQQTTDGGYIITGATSAVQPTLYEEQVYLLKTDVNGIAQWNQSFGGAGTDYGSEVQQTIDGGYIIVGTADYDDFIYLIKTDGNGNEQWNRKFSANANIDDIVFGTSVQQTTDGGYIITGNLNNPNTGYIKALLIKTDSDGYEQWTQTIVNFSIGNQYVANSVRQTTDGGYVFCGSIGSFDIINQVEIPSVMCLIKTDGSGVEQWTQTFGGTTHGSSVQQTTDGGYIITGGWKLIKTDGNGIEQWNQTFGLGTGEDRLNKVQQTIDGGYIITGMIPGMTANNETDVTLIKTDGNGIEQWSQVFGGLGWDFGTSVQQTTDGGYIIAGQSETTPWVEEVYLIKTDGSGNVTSTFNLPIDPNRKLEKTVDLLGKETKPQTNTPLIEIYDDGTVEKRIVIE